jgi:type I restriction enzyme S subunit
MFGDPVTNPKGWEVCTVEDALGNGRLLEIQDGNHGEKHPKVADFSTAGIPFVMANCLVSGQLDTEKAYKLDASWLKKLRIGFAKPGDLLLSHKGTVGELAIVPNMYPLVILSPQVTYYRIGADLDARFLAGYFSSAWFQSILKNEAEQSTRAYIGITRQRVLPLMLPPIELQREFARRVVVIEKILATQLKALFNNESLFNSLMQSAFEGGL